MIIPTGKVFKTEDGRTWFAVECFTEYLGTKSTPDEPKMTWQLFDDSGSLRGIGYLYKTGKYGAGIRAAKRCAKRRAKSDLKDRKKRQQIEIQQMADTGTPPKAKLEKN